MILTPNILARLIAVVLLGVLLQLSFFSQVEVFHTSPDVLPALIVVLGLLGGSMTGAVCGFGAGILLDCLLIVPLGGASLVLMACGYLAGMFRERFVIQSPLVAPLLCMILTLFAELGFGAVELMLGLDDATVSSLVLRDILIKSAYAFVLGWPIYLGLRRLLRPALVEDPAAPRRTRPTVLGA
ncbi:MAG TPA: rod shape-determining protein MreD [Solirubrobacterales bacterium]